MFLVYMLICGGVCIGGFRGEKLIGKINKLDIHSRELFDIHFVLTFQRFTQ